MKLEYDKAVDAAYLYLRYPLKKGVCKRQVKVNDSLIIDFDISNKMVGIEILTASKTLDKKVLEEASLI